MDWAAISIVAGVLAVAIVGIIGVTKIGINMDRRRSKRTRKAKGEYQPPEAPEGRYWG